MIRQTLILFLLAVLFETASAQDITSNQPVVLPLTGTTSYVVGSGISRTISSAQSVTLGPGVVFSAGSTVTVNIIGHILPDNPAENADMNWVQTMTYDEDGNEISASKAFFDLNGSLLQTQSKNESTGHVLASQPLYDHQQRVAVSTLAAPTNNASFAYKSDFVKNTAGGNYNAMNFDGDPDPVNPTTFFNKQNNPDPVGNMTEGTLGWYYSNNNNLEPYVASTEFPYSKTDYFRDGSGAERRAGGIGSELKIGSGHEVSSNAFPVVNELNNYLEIRAKINTITPLGKLPTSLLGNALQTISTDPNGTQGLSVTDLTGNALMTGRADENGWLAVTNTLVINNPVEGYKAVVKLGEVGNTAEEDNIVSFKVNTGENVIIKRNGTVVHNDLPGDTFELEQASANDGAVYEITCRKFFYYSKVKTNAYGPMAIENSTIGNFPALLQEPAASNIRYFQLTRPRVVTITGNYALYDMKAEALKSFTSGSVLEAGYYKVIALPAVFGQTPGSVQIAYTNKYSDISYNFYNHLGQLIKTIAPAGVKAYLDNPSAYNGSNFPFTNTFEYDLKGRMVAGVSTDGGRTEFIYRKDGSIRFSQNALQRNSTTSYQEKFSYTHYDKFGRPVESGEYVVPTGGTQTFQSLKTNTSVQESVSSTGGLSGGSKMDAITTVYDKPATDIALANYVQDEGFLKGAVSKTSSANSVTWYNYDAQGRVTWMVKKLFGINSRKTVDYSYNAQGNVIKVDYQKDVPAERFLHYYDYDADGRLVNVKTSRDDVNMVQHAKYYYYLHGPLKRVELGDNLQGIDYVYTADGKLKSINHSSGDSNKDPGNDGSSGNSFLPDAFGMQFEYYPNDYVRTNTNINSIATGETNYYNGNVNGISWQSKKPSTIMSDPGNSGLQNPTMYTYNYDPNYQLKTAKWGTPNFTNNTFAVTQKNPGTGTDGVFQERNITYDANGNILTMQRTDANAAVSDNFSTYQYEPQSNKLASVANYATFTYDELGQLKTQTKGGVTSYIKYDVTGKITGVYSDEAMTSPLVEYKYDESGNRMKASTTNNGTTTHIYYIYDASGNVLAMYTGSAGTVLSEVPVYGSDRLGMYRVSDSRYVYEMRDNVGSVKVVINRNRTSNGQLDVIQYNDYYPFGSIARQGGDGYKYEYQGAYAEKDPKTGWNNFDLRMYDSKIGRWLSVDPEGQFSSPYNGMGNNPVSGNDPSGGFVERPDDYTGPMGKGDWHVSDRLNNTNVWKNANLYNLQQSYGYKEYNTIKQRTAFYGWFQSATQSRGFETVWAGAAYIVADQMSAMDDPLVQLFTDDAVLAFGNAGNKAIFEDVFDNLRDLYNGPPLKGTAARAWDIVTLTHEQQGVVDKIYQSQTKEVQKALGELAYGSGLKGYMATTFGYSNAELNFKGNNIMNWKQRFSHGMNVVVPFYKKHGSLRKNYTPVHNPNTLRLYIH